MKFKFKNKKKSAATDVDKPEKENTPSTAEVNKKNKRKFPEEKSEENDNGLQSTKRSKKEKKVQPVSEGNQPEEIISKDNDVKSQSVKKSKKKKNKNKPKIEENHVEEQSDVESQSAKKSKKRKKTQPEIEGEQTAEVVSENNDVKSPSKKKSKKKKKKNQPAVEEEQADEAVSKSNEIESLFVQKPKKQIDAEANQNTENTSKNAEKQAGQKRDLSKNKNKNNSATGAKLLLPHQIRAEQESRTIFIGNLPVKFNKKKLEKLVGEYGKTETIRIRGAIPEGDKISKKVAVNKKMFNKDQQSLIAYVRCQTIEDARNALNLNGQVFEDRHLRVTLPTDKISDKNKGIFVGNLRFKVTDEELWDFFKDCGEILSVRVIRDKNNGDCKGFGYVNFKSEDSVEFALKLDGEKLLDREIRIQRLFSAGKIDKLRKKKERNNANGTNNQLNKNSTFKKDKTTGHKPGFNKKFKSNTDKTSSDKPGFKFKKQKNNVSKVDLKKKKLAEKLLAKSKKKPAASE